MTDAAAAVPLMLGRHGLFALLNILERRDVSWRMLQHTLPPYDKFADGQPLWFWANAIEWGIEQGVLGTEYGRGLDVPEPADVWSQEDIASFFKVPLATVRQRWRWRYTNAVKRRVDPPSSALPPEDFTVEGVALWLPETIKRWGVATGKLEPHDRSLRQRRGNRWIPARPPEVAEYVDSRQPLIDAGELMGYEEIGAYFEVQPKTVRAWHKVKDWDTEFKVGKDFPEPDGGAKDDGSPLWRRQTIVLWGHESKRKGRRKARHPHGAGRRSPKKAVARLWQPGTVMAWARQRGRAGKLSTEIDDSEMWNRTDIADVFGVCEDTVRYWIYRCGFPAPDVGDPVRRQAQRQAA